MKMMVMMVGNLMLISKVHMSALMSTILICAMTAMYLFMSSMSYWMSSLLILLYISGIMILFMFVVSLAPNEKTLPLNKKSVVTPTTISLALLTTMNMKNSNAHMTNSSYKANMAIMAAMLMVILLSAYIPPKVVIFLYKGMKTSK